MHAMGYRYVLHDKRLPGTPDICFPSRRSIVFVHGCFWHGHRCPRGFQAATNREFWAGKIARTRARDRLNRRKLEAMGWSVLEVYECATRPERIAALRKRLILHLGVREAVHGSKATDSYTGRIDSPLGSCR